MGYLVKKPGKIDWNADAVERLKQLHAAGASLVRASVALKGSMVVVRNKARELGIPFPTQRTRRHENEQKEDTARAKAGLALTERRRR